MHRSPSFSRSSSSTRITILPAAMSAMASSMLARSGFVGWGMGVTSAFPEARHSNRLRRAGLDVGSRRRSSELAGRVSGGRCPRDLGSARIPGRIPRGKDHSILDGAVFRVKPRGCGASHPSRIGPLGGGGRARRASGLFGWASLAWASSLRIGRFERTAPSSVLVLGGTWLGGSVVVSRGDPGWASGSTILAGKGDVPVVRSGVPLVSMPSEDDLIASSRSSDSARAATGACRWARSSSSRPRERRSTRTAPSTGSAATQVGRGQPSDDVAQTRARLRGADRRTGRPGVGPPRPGPHDRARSFSNRRARGEHRTGSPGVQAPGLEPAGGRSDR